MVLIYQALELFMKVVQCVWEDNSSGEISDLGKSILYLISIIHAAMYSEW